MKISSLLIIIFLISGFVTGFIGFYGALMAANGLTPADFSTSTNTSETLTSIETMYNITEASQNTTAVSGTATSDAPYNLLTGAFNAVMQTLNLPIFFFGLVTDLTTKVTGMPVWFAGIVNGIILVMIIAGLVKFFSGRDW